MPDMTDEDEAWDAVDYDRVYAYREREAAAEEEKQTAMRQYLACERDAELGDDPLAEERAEDAALNYRMCSSAYRVVKRECEAVYADVIKDLPDPLPRLETKVRLMEDRAARAVARIAEFDL